MATTRRDALFRIQEAAQSKWSASRIFEEDAPLHETTAATKFFVTFPYPYCNGFLHIGHSFSLSKAEFIVGYKRMKNVKCLFPFGFHCTGMPIQASANKLAKELEEFGNPPVFSNESNEVCHLGVGMTQSPHPNKGKATKGKVATKASTQKHQWDILRESGIAESDIANFANPLAWLRFFPHENIRDLKSFGLRVDWRRSFITTEENPYYDSFIRWQFNKLRKFNKIKFGKRHAIYSPGDAQPCADHDRATGEGVQPQEYTLIKLKVLCIPQNSELQSLLGDRPVFLPAATLRPETMYGQTNCWILPNGEYAAFELKNGEIFIMSRHAARNMSYQDFFHEFGVTNELGPVSGSDLIGLPVRAPLSPYERIYVLPLLTVSMVKGTGIVTSVPSDAPDDYRGLMDLKEKAALRAKFFLKDEWVLPYEPIPIIDTPGFGTLAAAEACIRRKIRSQNDRDALAIAKEEVYKAGFYQGQLLVGEMAGQSVMLAKSKIRDDLVSAGLARTYSEPEKKVTSRGGDECVVALCDQWYLEYGERSWRDKVKCCLSKMSLYTDETRNAFDAVLIWLKEWACSRQFGLGTKLPWDDRWLIESLSDSTIYMAYYTVAHLLQGGPENLDGHNVGPAQICSENMTDELWDFVLLGEGDPTNILANSDVLRKMRQEFLFWYPVNLRVSGKDLVGNHLTFFLYNHVALFPENHWPESIRVNGHVLLNAEKMSKSTGNFLTLRGAIQKYTSDGVRFALANATDTVEDANFAEESADGAILKLWTLVDVVEEAMENLELMESGEYRRFADRVFTSRLQKQLRLTEAAYENMLFREALKEGFFEMTNHFGKYREAVGADKTTRSSSTLKRMHKNVFLEYIFFQTVCIAPICPHTAEHIWGLIKDGLKENFGIPAWDSVMQVMWPDSNEPDESLLKASEYLNDVLSRIRVAIIKPAKKKKGSQLPSKPSKVNIFVRADMLDWQVIVVEYFRESFDEEAWRASRENNPSNENAWWKYPNDCPKRISALLTKDQMKNKRVMPFVAMVKKEVESEGSIALDRSPKFDEYDVLRENCDLILNQLKPFGICEVLIGNALDAEDRCSDAAPGHPTFVLV